MNQKILIPVSIIIAGVLVAGAVFYSGRQPNTNTPNPADGAEITVSPVTEEDWIRGNLDAKVTLIEFSDTECPFCKEFHKTMNQISNEYEPSEFAWVYRHLPLTQIHSKAGLEAVALECAGELGGQDAFWNYTNQIYEETPSNNGLNLSRLPEIAEEQGLDRAAFEACQDEKKHREEVQKDLDDATQSSEHLGRGTPGTPYSILVSQEELSDDAVNIIETIDTQLFNQIGQHLIFVSNDKMRVSLSGNLPKEMVKTIIDAALGKEIN